MAIRSAIQALYTVAAVVNQTGQMNANADAVRDSTAALIAATAQAAQPVVSAPSGKAEAYLRAMLCQLSADQPVSDPLSNEPAHLNTLRNRLGIDWMHSKAMEVANKYEAEFLPPAAP